MKFEKDSFVAFLKNLQNGSMLIVEAIKNRGKKQDENFEAAEKLLSEIKEEIKNKNLNVEIPDNKDDLQNIVKSLQQVEDAIKANKTEKVHVKNAIEILKPSWLPKFEISLDPITKFFEEIKTLLKKIGEKKEINLPMKDGRILVEVDRVAGGGGGGNSVNTSHLATLAKQSETLFHYKLARLPIAGDALTYLGYLNVDGGWYITEINETSGTQKYVKGDEDITTAWSNRASQSYQDFNQVF